MLSKELIWLLKGGERKRWVDDLETHSSYAYAVTKN